MQYRTLARTTVSAIGLGAMPLPIEHRPDETQAIATVHAALDAGVALVDTADSYHWHADEAGHNELLLARSPAVIPVPGAGRPASITDSARAVDLTRNTRELEELEDVLLGRAESLVRRRTRDPAGRGRGHRPPQRPACRARAERRAAGLHPIAMSSSVGECGCHWASCTTPRVVKVTGSPVVKSPGGIPGWWPPVEGAAWSRGPRLSRETMR